MATHVVIRNPKAYEKAQTRKQKRFDKIDRKRSEEQRRRNSWIADCIVIYVDKKGKSVWAKTHDGLLREFAFKILGNISDEALLEVGLGIVYAISQGKLVYEDPFIMNGIEYKAYSIPTTARENNV